MFIIVFADAKKDSVFNKEAAEYLVKSLLADFHTGKDKFLTKRVLRLNPGLKYVSKRDLENSSLLNLFHLLLFLYP